jgi:hypothetical protein
MTTIWTNFSCSKTAIPRAVYTTVYMGVQNTVVALKKCAIELLSGWYSGGREGSLYTYKAEQGKKEGYQ